MTPLPLPPGYEPLKGKVEPDVTTMAKRLLAGAMGTVTEFSIAGRHYLSRIEPHPPAPERGLNDWHKGVTIYERIAGSSLPPIVGAVLLGFVAWGAWRLVFS